MRDRPSTLSSLLQAAADQRVYAVEVLGEDRVSFFEREGFLAVQGSNGRVYYVFDRVAEKYLLSQRAPHRNTSKCPPEIRFVDRYPYWFEESSDWVIWGWDKDLAERKVLEEHFWMLHSFNLPRLDELVGLVLEIEDDVDDVLSRACDPLARPPHYSEATEAMLARIGAALDYDAYSVLDSL